MTTRAWLLFATAATVSLAVFVLADRFPQYPSYYNFADRRQFLGIPNALDVLSNLLYLIVGIAGLVELSRWNRAAPIARHKPLYVVFFVGITLTAFGSGYFHWNPHNASLIWDRLPMTILFMAFFASVIAELHDARLARKVLPALLLIGVGSVLYWGWTEGLGRGDLRLYGLVQFLPIVLIVMMLSLYPRPAGYGEAIGCMVFCYLAAKIFEQFDREIYTALGWVSGHALKHLISGLSGAFLLLWLRQRRIPDPLAG